MTTPNTLGTQLSVRLSSEQRTYLLDQASRLQGLEPAVNPRKWNESRALRLLLDQFRLSGAVLQSPASGGVTAE